MGYRVLRTDAFEDSYDAAISYLIETLQSPQAARRLINKVDEIATILEEAPFINAISSKPFLAERNLREHFFMKYAIVYLVNQNAVVFVNLFHQTQDYNNERHWSASQ